MPDNRFGTLTWDQRRHIHHALVHRAKHLADTGRRDEAETVNQLIADLTPPIKFPEATNV